MFTLILLHFFKMKIVNFIVPSFVAFGNVKNNILSGGCPNLFFVSLAEVLAACCPDLGGDEKAI